MPEQARCVRQNSLDVGQSLPTQGVISPEPPMMVSPSLSEPDMKVNKVYGGPPLKVPVKLAVY